MPKLPSSPARHVVESVVWYAVTNPVMCECGHLHYGRIKNHTDAPQWHYCEEEKCRCKGLRPAHSVMH